MTPQSKAPRSAFGLRFKLVLAITVTTILAVAALGYLGSTRARQTQMFLSDQLQSVVHELIEHELNDDLAREAAHANAILQSVTDDVALGASYASKFFNQPLNQGDYWDAEQKLQQLAAGQLDNPNVEPASVFVPAGVSLTETLRQDLNTAIHLDFVGPTILNHNPNITGLYYIHPTGAEVYYPNIDLASQLPADFQTADQPYFTLAAPQNNPGGKNIWTPPYRDPAGAGLIVTNVSPIYDQNNEFRGVLAADVQLTRLADEVTRIRFGKTGYAFLIDSAGHILAMHPDGYQDFHLTPEEVPVNGTPRQTVLADGPPELQSVFRLMTTGSNSLTEVTLNGVERFIAYAPLSAANYSLGVIVPVEEMTVLLAETNTALEQDSHATLQFVVLLLVAILAGALLVSIGFSRVLTASLDQLTRAAQQISAGNFEIEAKITSGDEIGTLARAFNLMAAELRNLIGSLEQRVTERTRALSLSAEVSRRLSAILDQQQLIAEVVEQIKIAFNYYHVHIYLYDAKREYLVLVGGTGEAARVMLARAHQLEEGRGLVGRAAGTNSSVLVPDVTKDPGWLPNPLLPDTKTELAVPIAIGGRVLGVLDVQHNRTYSLGQDDVQLIQSIANQVAIALQNIRSYEQAQHKAERESLIATLGEKIQRASTVEGVLQIASRELGKALGAQRATTQIGIAKLGGRPADPQGDAHARAKEDAPLGRSLMLRHERAGAKEDPPLGGQPRTQSET